MTSPDPDPLLETEALVCGYEAPILGPLDLDLPADCFALIEGPNGIGKSTLIETWLGLLAPLAGDIAWRVDEERLRYVPQVRTLDPVLPATVGDVVATGTLGGGGLQGLRGTAGEEAIAAALERVEMRGYRHHLFRELSEGQKQLVLLARALIGEPAAILLDEPTASMDPDREERAFELLARARREQGVAMIAVAHGSEPARRAADLLVEIDHDRSVTLRDL